LYFLSSIGKRNGYFASSKCNISHIRKKKFYLTQFLFVKIAKKPISAPAARRLWSLSLCSVLYSGSAKPRPSQFPRGGTPNVVAQFKHVVSLGLPYT
jgi:hypothetical protein